MSKDNSNLRLLGSPVNLSYRNKKKDDRKNIRNRPRSALQNSCLTPDVQERYKRPFSADTKDRASSTRSFLKTFTADLLQSYNNSPTPVRVVPPTTDLLRASIQSYPIPRDKDLCSNASDYGSEDTFISLGTKIKARAQSSPKPKNSNNKNHLKYRNINKRNRKAMENNLSEDQSSLGYGMEVKITERPQRLLSPKRKEMLFERNGSPFKSHMYESYFVPLDSDRKSPENSLAECVTFGNNNIQAEVEEAIDSYSRRLTLTQQQLSLVEEESTQDLESVPSQHMPSLSPENSLGDPKNINENVEENYTGRNTYVVDVKDDDYCKPQTYLGDTRTYSSFYDDFHTNNFDNYKTKMSSTVLNTDSSSKDSGYHDSGTNDEKNFGTNFSLPSTSLKRSKSQNKVEDQPKSLDSVSTTSNEKGYKTFPLDKKYPWSEPLNHSRLLYKDFFLKKEGHIALPPQNSPSKSDIQSIPSTSETADVIKTEKDVNLDYPSYLMNSTTKAYTSKVIEDYKKEIEAINNLHELTLKDIKTESISPTPLNIDKMFELNSSTFNDDKKDISSPEDSDITDVPMKNNMISNCLENNKIDISKVSTKELIQNYLKVKEGDYLSKNNKKFDKKNSNLSLKFSDTVPKQEWNNKNSKAGLKSTIPVNIRNQTQRHLCNARTPLSARIESVQHDKDIDSWMSLSAPSPRNLEVNEVEPIAETSKPVEIKQIDEKIEDKSTVDVPTPSTTTAETPKSKELNSNSTVLDIYSMLKEIESYGDNPVTSVARADVPEASNQGDSKKEEDTVPKDNFLEIFEFLEKVEQSANDALSVVTSATPQTVPKLEVLLKLPSMELAQRLVTASLQLEERSCCIALLQESLANHKEQMVNKVSNLEKQSLRNIAKVKQECEETIKRHQNFIDQLINDKKTLNHRIEQLVDERRSLEERWKRSAQALEERYKLELRNQHDKMAAAQQELTVKGLEGELREMAERQQKEVSDLKMSHAEQMGRAHAKHAAELEELRRTLEAEKETALVKERQMAATRLEKQILELELTYQEQRTRLMAEMRAENERAANDLGARERERREEIEKWREEQEKLLEEKKLQLQEHIAEEKEKIEEQLKEKTRELEQKFEQYKKEFEAEQQMNLKRKISEISAQHKLERDREIERAIDNMEAEAQVGRKELQEAIRRNKEQYEAELKELAETEQATLRRYQEAQARVRHTEQTCADFEVTISQLETRNKLLIEKNNQLEAQMSEIRSSAELAWAQRVDSLKKETDDMKRTHEEQMHQLYAKVKVAVARKDSAIQALTREAGKYQEKITLLEQKLQQQRKDFLKQK
ncbi:centrosomal protein of 131 kDa isoform X2 [Plodia interpunctella]|uniref:centrosomal protein of 131 kDa isoform X2 n=1 Tax=Plodia interpunctella TaxID=58824 RepID=UPI002367AAA8|nr:centrosomal protein of 131 kDa isoform X2 [Plodia interpunctella]